VKNRKGLSGRVPVDKPPDSSDQGQTEFGVELPQTGRSFEEEGGELEEQLHNRVEDRISDCDQQVPKQA
jgi:hypothetical protein